MGRSLRDGRPSTEDMGMRFSATPIEGLWVIEPEPATDERGSFARIFCTREFEERGISFRPVQSNVSTNRFRGTLRGLHLQRPPHAEAKLMRCVRGSVHVAAVDVRPQSSTLAESFTIRLSASEGPQLYIPEGMANGFQTLEDDSEVLYLMSEFYEPEAGHGYRYDDPTFAIAWPLPVSSISESDLALPNFDRRAFDSD